MSLKNCLESEALESLDRVMDGKELAAQLSTAVSLKRIADALDAIRSNSHVWNMEVRNHVGG